MTGASKFSLWIATATVALLSMGGVAGAQVYYQHPGAPAVSDAEPAVGATFALGDDLIRLLGYGRFNVTEESDFGLEVLLDHFDPAGGDDAWRFGAAVDYKYAIVPLDTELPFDLAVDGGFGFQSGADITNINVPIGGIVSRPFALKSDRILEPYAAVYVIFSHTSFDPPGPGSTDDTDLDVELRLGTSIEVVAGTSAFVTVHIGDDEMFFMGVNASL